MISRYGSTDPVPVCSSAHAAVARSVSLAAGRREQLLSVVVPLADQETSASASTDSLTAATVLARPAHL